MNGMQESSAVDERRFALCLAIIVALLLPFCFLGYGPDNDTYGVLDSGRVVWQHHILQTSRAPGYWVYEALIFVLASVGGFVLTNLATLAVSAAVLWRFYVIARKLGVRFPLLLTACLAAVPVYAIASTTTMDYVWSMLGLVLMVECIASDRWGWAAAAATFGYLIRGANCVVIAGILLGGLIAEYLAHRRLTARSLRIVGVGCAAAVLGSLPFLASYRAAGNSMSFSAGVIGSSEMWTLKMRVGRFLYKGILLFSLPGWLVLAWGYLARQQPTQQPSQEVLAYRQKMLPLLIGGLLMNALLFYKFSLEISYLLPGAAFLLLALGSNVLAKQRALPLAFLCSLLLADVVTLRLAVPNKPGHSTDARLRPGLERGQLVDATTGRLEVLHCRTNDCWAEKSSDQWQKTPANF